ncbi:conserved hypothetical protein [Treponema primitia ZAS-2]|uniref:DNA repair photolyase n=1 Tax=Treponema primitia (strain ATCC BAA-887 / DSM 12427 / ZAS-2) TaxID=545694 RepID=F5YNA6_TREPZ|nr:DUF1848 domain-containing protein [Treponema primitia]AEF86060.1 conserved hypothetical protein [Treponema primitia ZAS-2]
MIISVSRRCDIPRFQFDWFMERLDTGFVDVPNPFNRKQLRRVSLSPGDEAEDAQVLIFWTRDPRPILERGTELEERGHRFCVMTTLTTYPALLEPNPPPTEAVIAAMRELSDRFGPKRIIWRYDPVLLSNITDAAFHLRNFKALANSLSGAVSRVIISVYDEYAAAKRRLAALEQGGAFRVLPHYAGEGPGTELLPKLRGELRCMWRTLLARLAETAADAGMTMQSCAEAEDMTNLGIIPGACIDGELIRKLWGIEAAGKDKNQRPHCRCALSADIGSYGPCPAGCVYCYARR